MAKRLFRVSMTVDAAVLFDVTAAASGKAYNLEVVPIVETTKRNGHDGNAKPRDLLHRWMAAQKQFSTREILAFAATLNISNGAAYKTTSDALKDGILERLGPGLYRPTGKTGAPKSTHGGDRRSAKAKRNVPGPPSADFIIGMLRKSPLPARPITMAFEADNRPAGTAHSALNRLLTNKLIRRSREGIYELTEKGQQFSSSSS